VHGVDGLALESAHELDEALAVFHVQLLESDADRSAVLPGHAALELVLVIVHRHRKLEHRANLVLVARLEAQAADGEVERVRSQRARGLLRLMEADVDARGHALRGSPFDARRQGGRKLVSHTAILARPKVSVS